MLFDDSEPPEHEWHRAGPEDWEVVDVMIRAALSTAQINGADVEKVMQLLAIALAAKVAANAAYDLNGPIGCGMAYLVKRVMELADAEHQKLLEENKNAKH